MLVSSQKKGLNNKCKKIHTISGYICIYKMQKRKPKYIYHPIELRGKTKGPTDSSPL